MDYVDRAFVDEVVHLDGNTFTRCSFEECVLRYYGGATVFLDRTSFKTENRFEFAEGVDAHSDPIVQWILAAMRKEGGTAYGDPKVAEHPSVAPKKDLG